MKFLQPNWCDLQWSPWVSFDQVLEKRDLLPKEPGMYRIKPKGLNQLVYIRQTSRSLRQRVAAELAKHSLQLEMPYNDPHTAAPSLWAWHDAEGYEYECSGAPIDLTKADREGLECYLLWQYRLEYGESTLCNHGRFHKGYLKSKERAKGFRGHKITDGSENPAGSSSTPPLELRGKPTDLDFMGLLWSPVYELNSEFIKTVPNTRGAYRIIDPDSHQLIYIGQSSKLRDRLKNHSLKNWDSKVQFSYCILENLSLPHQLKEIENDLLGGFYALNKCVPRYQFIDHK